MLVTDKKMNDIVSKLPQVRGEVEAQTLRRASVAAARLAQHRDRGDAQIESFVAFTDGYIVLSDERGFKAAAAIEYGTHGGDVKVRVKKDKQGRNRVSKSDVRVVHRKPTKGVGALRAAAALE
ncbi:DUF5403 family protein [Schaalia sp. ZJ1691]|uniref:DUF5403 family protein n=1 Tax=Schaalia sp. ZJ1691 TaxID=2709404 RepID=UPI0013E9D439|nr:DUF5403 family protein [Schaalia sp. ZJ1691]